IESWRIRSLRPRIDSEITDSTLPLEVGLTDAVAQQKGCYPGQEVIERTLSLGAPARRLARVEGTGPAPAPGEPLFNLAEPPAEVGKVTSVSQEGGRFFVLAFLRKIHAKEGLEVRFTEHQGQVAHGKVAQIAPFH